MRLYKHIWDSILNYFHIKLSFDFNKFDVPSPIDLYKSIISKDNPTAIDEPAHEDKLTLFNKKHKSGGAKRLKYLHILFTNYKKAFNKVKNLLPKFNFDLNSLKNKKNNEILEGNDLDNANSFKVKKETNWQNIAGEKYLSKRTDQKKVNNRFIINQQHNNIKNNHLKKLEEEVKKDLEKNIDVNF